MNDSTSIYRYRNLDHIGHTFYKVTGNSVIEVTIWDNAPLVNDNIKLESIKIKAKMWQSDYDINYISKQEEISEDDFNQVFDLVQKMLQSI